MPDSEKYFDRDISWLSFNSRVLMEAADDTVPLYERIKFLAIYSSNLDEFFRVRVAAMRSIVDIDKKKINKKFAKKPSEVLNELLKEVNRQQEAFGRIKRQEIIPKLKEQGIFLYRNDPIRQEHKAFVEHYFKSRVLSYLQPIIMTAPQAKTPYLDNMSLYFAIALEAQNGDKHYAHLKIPTDHLQRFIALPKIEDTYYYIAIDDIIREEVDFLFPGFKVVGCYCIKLNRDADLNIEDEFSGDLVKKIRKQIDKRNLGVPSRFLYDKEMPQEMLAYLKDTFLLKDEDLVPGGRYHNMNDLMELENPLSPRLENKPLPPLVLNSLEKANSIFEAIEAGDVMLHFPYQSYDYVLRFFNEAALDPQVEEINATFYRIAANSFISSALISAANNGKKVTVFIEIKARFDEQNNLQWAERMEKAGIKIIYSIPGLKVHAKVALIKKKVGDVTTKYGFLGTGNFNEKTASIYADEALLTNSKQITQELESVFEYLSEKKYTVAFKHLLVSQFNILDELNALIDYEIAQAQQGKKAYIILKLNNLQDDIMIDKLYEASQAGVKIDLIIRAICCIKPGVEGLSENITVRRIVDRFLEHSRVYYFYHSDEEKIYLGSADWMKRNLYRRIEVVYPLYDKKARNEVLQLLKIQLADNTKACLVNDKLENVRFTNQKTKVRAQEDFYTWLKENASN